MEKESIFTRFINMIKSIFGGKTTKQIPEQTESKDVNVKEKPNFRNEIKLEKEEDPELLRLQEKFENNEITFDDMTDEQLHNLNLLYKRQVADLEKKLDGKKTELNMLKYELKNLEAQIETETTSESSSETE